MPPPIRVVVTASPPPPSSLSMRCLLPAAHPSSSFSSFSSSFLAAFTTNTNTNFTSTTTTTTARYRRAFSTTAPLPRQKPSHLTVPADQVPDYPYGRFRTYKQRNEGLFGGAKVRFGNTVAAKWGRKSGTHWLPNRHAKRLWSPALGAFVRTRLTAAVLKTVDKLGGIDEYLLGSKARRIRELGPAGWALRWKIIQTPAIQERFARERAALGLPPKGEAERSADAAAAAALPAELQGGGATAQSVMAEVDQMLARDEEFVIGEVKDDEEILVRAEREEMGDVVVEEEDAEDAPRTSVTGLENAGQAEKKIQ
ncbi:hypothetical protein F4809DRAFT_127034 [Biscogniauxia mediterranea]|nr:hypothetical protein F4809DRAFT_127034 [Biscogniauxia mediterranea]